MSRQKLLILPRLHACNGDNAKQWFVYYSCQDPSTSKMKRFRIYDGFAELQTKKQKLQHGQGMVESLKEKLLNGWTPFEDRSKVIYSDDLVYKKVARTNGRLRIKDNPFIGIKKLKTETK